MNIAEIYPNAANEPGEKLVREFMNALLIRSNFMSNVRHALGWRGLKCSCRHTESWTLKVKGREGVFGLCYRNGFSKESMHWGCFELYYFPAADDIYLKGFAMETMALVSQPSFNDYIRDFMAYPEVYPLFNVAGCCLGIDPGKGSVIFDMRAREYLYSYCSNDVLGFVNDEFKRILAHGELDQYLPASELVHPLSKVMGATLTFNLKATPSRISHYTEDARSSDRLHVWRMCFGTQGADLHPDILADFGASFHENLLWDGEATMGSAALNPMLVEPDAVNNPEYAGKDAGNKPDMPRLIVLSGYLGAGKTRFIQNLIEYHVRNRRFVAVIQNEVGETGLDGKLLEDQYAVLEMDEGCVCCSLAGQLKKGILNILSDHKPEIIILETSGVANPFNLLSELHEVEEYVKLSSVTTIVDALNFPLNSSLTPIANQQVLAADVILLNKADLVNEKELEDIRHEVRRLNGQARIYTTHHANINPALVYGIDQAESRKFSVPTDGSASGHVHANDGTESCKLAPDAFESREDFVHRVEAMNNGIYRMKGIVSFLDEPGKHVFQYVNGHCEIEDIEIRENSEDYIILIGNANAISHLDQTILLNHKN